MTPSQRPKVTIVNPRARGVGRCIAATLWGWVAWLLLCTMGLAAAPPALRATHFGGPCSAAPAPDDSGPGAADPQDQDPGQEHQPVGIGDLLAVLEGRGAESVGNRVRAVRALLERREAKAHRGLQGWLLRPPEEDPEGVRAVILAELLVRWGDPADPVFGSPVQPGGDGGPSDLPPAASEAGYLPALARCWGEASTAPELRAAVRRALRAMGPRSRLEGFGAWIAVVPVNDNARAGLLRLAGESGDLLLAPWLARWLEHPKEMLRESAQGALGRLVFREANPIRTAAEFAAWAEAHQGWTHDRLAEHLAREAQRLVALERSNSAKRVGALRVALVESLVAQGGARIPWARIQQEVLQEGLPAEECLLALVDALEPLEHPEATSAARLAFHSALLARFDASQLAREAAGTAGPAEDESAAAVMLQVAAGLLRPEEVAPRGELEARARIALARGDAPHSRWSLRVLQALQRFPSVSNRQAVVELATRTCQELGFRSEDADLGRTLQQCLSVLARRGLRGSAWYAPGEGDVDGDAWPELLRNVLQLPGLADAKRLAVEVARQPTAAGGRHPLAFEVVRAMVADPEQAVELRTLGRIALQEQVDGREQAEEFVRLMVTLLRDPEARVRSDAAQASQELPAALQQDAEVIAEWSGRLLDAAAAQLGSESDPAAFKALASLLVLCAEPSRNLGPSRVVRVLANAVVNLPKQVEGQVDKRRADAVARLTTLAARPEAELRLGPKDLWVAVEALEKGGDLRQLWVVFGANRSLFSEPMPEGGAGPEVRLGVALLDLAVATEGDVDWEGDPVRRALLLQGWSRLVETGWSPAVSGANAAHGFRQLLVVGRAYGAKGRHQDAIGTADRVLGAAEEAPIRALAAVRKSEALVALGRLDEALQTCAGLAASTPGIDQLTERLANALIEAGQPRKAIPLFEQLVALEDPSADAAPSVAWHRQWLALQGARLATAPQDDPNPAQLKVLAALQLRQEWFSSEACPVTLKTAYTALLKQLRTQGR